MSRRTVMSRRTRTALVLLPLATCLALTGCGEDKKDSPSWATAAPSASSTSAAPGTPSASGGSATASTAASRSEAPASKPAVEQPPANEVQGLLSEMNYDVKVTGSYDAQTVAAVKRFQAKHKLEATGVVDDATWDEMMTTSATMKPSAPPTQTADGLDFDGTWWSSGSFYRSKNRQCVVHEQEWQRAVVRGSKSASVEAHSAAKALGCDPDVWTPNGMQHDMVDLAPADGESCSASQAGDIAIGTYPNAICNQETEGVWKWQVMSG